MLSGFGQRFDQSLRSFVPFFTCFVFLLMSVVTWPLPHVGAISPSLGLAAIYYWSLHRPDLLRPFSVFFLGLLNDALNFFPFGLSAFVFVALHQLALSQRRFFVGQVFPVLWGGFGIMAVIAMLAQWIGLSLYQGHATPMLPIFWQTIFSILVFPAPAWLLIHAQRLFLSQR